MKALLMHPDRDWDQEPALAERFRTFRRESTVSDLRQHEHALMQDLALETLLIAMAGTDEFLFEVARRAVLSGQRNDLETILYRQAILKDCLKSPAVVRELYALVVDTIEARRKEHYWGFAGRYPSSILYSAIGALRMFAGMLRRMRGIADAHAGRFESAGFTGLFAMLQEEFNDEYFTTIQNHLTRLKFNAGVLVSAELDVGNQGTNYVLRQVPDDGRSWLQRLLGTGSGGYTFYIHERDEAGARALSELRDRGINLVANAVAQSTDHILSFFEVLRTELAFYIGCVNLHDRLAALGAPACFPRPEPAGTRRQRAIGVYDVCLALTMGHRVVGNSLDGDGKRLMIITGANQGGKSTFLRSLGLAQIMMQCGMFVAADSFAADVCTDLFTHYKREEDATMKHGKLEEELARMSELVDAMTPDAILLFNESFASTNEREGSEIARQVVRALLEKRVKVLFVTHLYDFARSLFERRLEEALFLRAERLADGTRTFKIVPGEPLETSYGEDLYRQIFGSEVEEVTAL